MIIIYLKKLIVCQEDIKTTGQRKMQFGTKEHFLIYII